MAEGTSLRTINLHLNRTQKEVDKANEQVKEYGDKLNKATADRDSNDQKLLAELDDLTRTKQFLEERLIELLRLVLKKNNV